MVLSNGAKDKRRNYFAKFLFTRVIPSLQLMTLVPRQRQIFIQFPGDPRMIQRSRWRKSTRYRFLEQRRYQMFSLFGYVTALRKLYFRIVLQAFLHFLTAVARLVERVLPVDQLVRNNPGCPHVSFLNTIMRKGAYLGIRKVVQYLLGRCIEQSPTLSEVLYRVLRRFDSKAKVNQLDLGKVIVVHYHDVFRFHVPVDHVHRVVKVLKCTEDSFHDLGALVFCELDASLKLLEGFEAQFHFHNEVI